MICYDIGGLGFDSFFPVKSYFDLAYGNPREEEEPWFLIIFAAKCIDFYTKLRQQAEDCIEGGDEMKPDIDPRLEAIVDRMFEKCLAEGQNRQAVGIAIETRRMDVFENAIRNAVSFLICCY